MSLPTLALFERTLRVESRRGRTYWWRVGLIVILGLTLLQMTALMRGAGAPGLAFFKAIVSVNLVVISVLGAFFFGAAIAEEKEEMTLGLLRMTRLSPVAILLGKAGSRLVSAVTLLLVQVPFVLLAVTLGGVSLRQVIAAYATLLAYAVMLAGLALPVSVAARTAGDAAAGTLVLMAIFFIGPRVGLAALLAIYGPNLTDARLLLLTRLLAAIQRSSPLTRLEGILASGFTGWPVGFQFVADIGLGAVAFLFSWLIFDWFTREESDAGPRRGFLRALVTPKPQDAQPQRGLGLRLFAPGRVWANAIAWKEFHFGAGGVAMILGRVILLLGVAGAIMLFILLDRGQRDPWSLWGVGTLSLVLVIAGLEMVMHAGNMLNAEVRWGTLPMLATLPLSAGELLWAKVRGRLGGWVVYVPFLVVSGLVACSGPAALVQGIAAQPFVLLVPAMILFEALLLFYMILYFSLVMPRGGGAVGFILYFFVRPLAPSPFFLFAAVTPSTAFGTFAIGAGVTMLIDPLLIVGFHFAVLRRLRRAMEG